MMSVTQFSEAGNDRPVEQARRLRQVSPAGNMKPVERASGNHSCSDGLLRERAALDLMLIAKEPHDVTEKAYQKKPQHSYITRPFRKSRFMALIAKPA